MSAAVDHRVDRVRDLGTSAGAAGCVLKPTSVHTSVHTSVDDRLTAELRAFAGGDAWFRAAALDVYVPTTLPTTQGHLAWSPPT